jgi:hypothetical protein
VFNFFFLLRHGSCRLNCEYCISKAVPLYAKDGAQGERRYSSYSFLTSALEGGEWSASHPGRALPPALIPVVQDNFTQPKINVTTIAAAAVT